MSEVDITGLDRDLLLEQLWKNSKTGIFFYDEWSRVTKI
jgi:hypothetical protein